MDQKLKAQILKDLYAHWTPHKKQQEFLNAVLFQGYRKTLSICGRNWGKTEEILHILGRIGLTRETLSKRIADDEIVDSYYVAPSIVHARRLIWDNKRLYQMIPKKYILDIHKNDRMIYLTTNGKDMCAWIKVEGTEDVLSLEGVKHKGPMAIDEVYMIDRRFLQSHDPDLAAYNPPFMLFSTWPREFPHWIDRLAREYRDADDKLLMVRPGTDNPTIELEIPGYWQKTEREYKNRGEEKDFRRIYLSIREPGGASQIFPNFKFRTYLDASTSGGIDPETLTMVDKEAYEAEWEARGPRTGDHVRRHSEILERLKKHGNGLIPIIAADPGHASAFAMIFMAYDPYTKDWFLLDEIYETRRNIINTPAILKRAVDMAQELYPWAEAEAVRKVCDEAALWFRTESIAVSSDVHGPTEGKTVWAWSPTKKSEFKHEWGFSLINSAMVAERFWVSDRCIWTIWELSNYSVNEKNKIDKQNDHAIDCIRYGMGAVRYSLDSVMQEAVDEAGPKRRRTIEDDMEEERLANEETWGGEDDY